MDRWTNEADGITLRAYAVGKQVETDMVCEFTESAGLVASLGNQCAGLLCNGLAAFLPYTLVFGLLTLTLIMCGSFL